MDVFSLLRALSCLLVIGSHIQRAELHADALERGYTWMTVVQGHVGVWIFFILSGYLISKGFFSGKYTYSFAGVVQFYKKRIWTVYIPYVLVSLSVLFLFHAVSLQRIFDVIFLRGERVYLIDEISYLWTIPNIIAWYLIAPVCCALCMPVKKTSWGVYVLAVCIFVYGLSIRWWYLSVASVKSFPEYNIAVYIRFFANVDFFLWGMWLHMLPSFSFGRSGKIYSFFLLISSYMYATYYLSGVYGWKSWAYMPYALHATLAVILGVLFFLYAWKDTKISIARSWYGSILKSVHAISAASYGIYLLQTPLISCYSLSCTKVMCSAGGVMVRGGIVLAMAMCLVYVWQTVYVFFLVPRGSTVYP